MHLYPAEVEEESEKASKRGTEEKKVRLYPAEIKYEAKILIINRNSENQKWDSRL